MELPAVGIDGDGVEHPRERLEGRREDTATVQVPVDDPITRGRDPNGSRSFVVDGAQELIRMIRKGFGCHTPIQRCRSHNAQYARAGAQPHAQLDAQGNAQGL